MEMMPVIDESQIPWNVFSEGWDWVLLSNGAWFLCNEEPRKHCMMPEYTWTTLKGIRMPKKLNDNTSWLVFKRPLS